MGNRIPSLMAMLAIGLVQAQVGRLAAQTFKILHSFTPLGDYRSGFGTNGDGAGPWGGLTLLGNTLYGVAAEGGTWGNGTVFKVNTDGTGFAPLYSFSTAEGAHPVSALVASGNTLYGTAQLGGISNNGTLFAINTEGMGFTQLHSFTAASAWPCPCVNGDGAGPYAGLALLGDRLYGATIGGGSLGGGTVFSVNLDGTRFTTLHSFSQADLPLYAHPPWGSFATLHSFSAGGADPIGTLVALGNTLYGTALAGGTSSNGTVFAINMDGTGFTNLYSFAAGIYTNTDGIGPSSALIASGNTLYGTALAGGASGNGTVFAVEKDGTQFRTLHSFTTAFNGVQLGAFGLPLRVNSDGASPQAKLILSGNTLYGTTFYGGSWGAGTVFAVKTDGTRFTTLHTFTTIDNAYANSDGAAPLAGLVLSGNTLYGEAIIGGQWGRGTIFSLSIPRPLTISCKTPLPLECTNGGSTGTVSVELEASGSVPVVLVWTIDGTPYQTNTVPKGEVSISTNLTFTADFALGEHLVTVSASNQEITPATCSATVQVRDTTPPRILSVSATPNLLWPPNQQMVSVTIEVQATDNCGPTTSKIVGVTSNEATRSFGRNNAPDWLISGDLNVDLRAERLGNAEGRIYTILIECNDVAGNSSFSLVTVGVPHNRGQP